MYIYANATALLARVALHALLGRTLISKYDSVHVVPYDSNERIATESLYVEATCHSDKNDMRL